MANINVEKIISECEKIGIFDDERMYQIIIGLQNGIDVSVYSDPKFDAEQMGAIRRGLEKKLDVSVYADPKFDHLQMEIICSALEKGIDLLSYVDSKYNAFQMTEVLIGLEDHLNVAIYCDPSLTAKNMNIIRLKMLEYKDSDDSDKTLVDFLDSVEKSIIDCGVIFLDNSIVDTLNRCDFYMGMEILTCGKISQKLLDIFNVDMFELIHNSKFNIEKSKKRYLEIKNKYNI